MRAIRSRISLRVLASTDTTVTLLSAASRSCNCSTLTSFGPSYPWQEVIVFVVFRGRLDGQQIRQALKRVLTQVRLLSDSDFSRLRRQHPCRYLQPRAICIENDDCPVSAFGPTNELEGSAVQRVERI